MLGSQGGGIPAEIVGVVGDVRSITSARPGDVEIYRANTQRPGATAQLVVRSRTDPLDALASVRVIVRQLDPELPLTQPSALRDIASGSLGQQKLLISLLRGFALVSLVLAVGGIWSVLSYIVQQRTAEIGLRVALGAPRHALLLVGMQSLRPVAGCFVFGLLGAPALAQQVLASHTHGVQPMELWLIASAWALLLGGAIGASVAPARRALRVDPLIALRE